MLLGINVDHCATLREARKGRNPDPVAIAVQAEIAGANSITVHLREDRRHIQDRDVQLLRKVVSTRLNLEMAPTSEMLQIAINLKPDTVTIVPEKREEITTESGFAVSNHIETLTKIVNALKSHNIMTYFFIDVNLEQIKASKKCGAFGIEFNTGSYANSFEYEYYSDHWQLYLDDLKKMSLVCQNYGLSVHAGHGLNYQNISYISEIQIIEELNIGHSIISQSLSVGIQSAVKTMLKHIQ